MDLVPQKNIHKQHTVFLNGWGCFTSERSAPFWADPREVERPELGRIEVCGTFPLGATRPSSSVSWEALGGLNSTF